MDGKRRRRRRTTNDGRRTTTTTDDYVWYLLNSMNDGAKGDLNKFNEVQDVARLCDGDESVFTSVLSPTIVAQSSNTSEGSSAIRSRSAGLAEPNHNEKCNTARCYKCPSNRVQDAHCHLRGCQQNAS